MCVAHTYLQQVVEPKKEARGGTTQADVPKKGESVKKFFDEIIDDDGPNTYGDIVRQVRGESRKN